MNMIPELVQMTCSMMGAWGNATANGTDEDGNAISGGLLQMRTLDWEDKGPFQKYMTVTVYHPEEGNGHAFAMFGFPAFIAALTGYSDADVGISEKAWLKTDADGAKKSRFGYPNSKENRVGPFMRERPLLGLQVRVVELKNVPH